MLDQFIALLIYVRDQCMPVPIDGEPGFIDYAIVTVAAVSVVGGVVWFIRALWAQDTPEIQAIKSQVLED